MLITWSKIASRSIYSVTICVCVSCWINEINPSELPGRQSVIISWVAEKLHPLGPEMWIVHGCSINLWIFMQLTLVEICFQPQFDANFPWNWAESSWSVDESHPKPFTQWESPRRSYLEAQGVNHGIISSIGVKPFPTARRVVHS